MRNTMRNTIEKAMINAMGRKVTIREWQEMAIL